jgi:hypothetical protein
MLRLLDIIKRLAYDLQGLFFYQGDFCAAGWAAVFTRRAFEQFFLGVGSLFLVVLTGFSPGRDGAAILHRVGRVWFEELSGASRDHRHRRELGPTLTGRWWRRGSRLESAEIGSMKSSEQIDALTAFGVDPIRSSRCRGFGRCSSCCRS